MKKIRFILFFLLIVIISGGLGNKAYASEQGSKDVTVNLTTYFSESEQISKRITGSYYGNKLVLANELDNNGDLDFSFWILDGVVRSDLSLNHEFILTENMDLKAVFKPIGKYTVVFRDTNGKLFDIQYVDYDKDASEPVGYEPANRPGYRLIGWDTPLTNIKKDTVITLKYEKENDSEFKLTIYGGYIVNLNKSVDFIKYNEIVTIEADETSDNKPFSHWVINNQIVSTDKQYSLTMLSDTKVVAVYQDTQINDEPRVYLSESLNIIENKNTYLGQFYLPNDYTLIEFGMITSSTHEVINLDTEGIVRHKGFIYVPNTNEWMMSFSNPRGVRAYLVYRDFLGNIETVYNSIVDQTPSSELVNIETNVGNNPDLIGWSKSLTSTNVDYWNLGDKGKYIESPKFSALSGPLTVTLNAWATGSITTNTYTIEAFDSSHNYLSSESVTLIGKDTSNYIDYTHKFENVNKNIAYIKITYNKETTGTNLRIQEILIKEDGTSKEISHIDAHVMSTSYIIGSNINLLNSAVIVYYTDGTISINELTQDMITGFSTTKAGTYTGIVNYKGFTDSFSYSVDYLTPVYTVPILDDIEFREGLKLLDVSLPSGFTWNNPDTLLTLGNRKYTATFTPSDPKYHSVHNIEITVNVVSKISTVIIYEVYGGGGNSGATYNQDYIVLYNTTNKDIDLSNYTIQYGSSTGTTFTAYELSGMIYSEGYYVIGIGSANAVNGEPLPFTSINVGGNGMAEGSGKVALVKSKTPISNYSDTNIVDFIGYGNANEFEISKTVTLTEKKSARRNNFIDTDNNGSDFTIDTPNLSYLNDNKELVNYYIDNLRQTYQINEELDLIDVYLNLYYKNGEKSKILVTPEMISGFNTNTIGNYTMTIIYDETNFNYPYNVFDYSNNEEVNVYYIDIGASGGKPGESSLIKVGNVDILIDSGDDDANSETELLSFLNQTVTDGTIEYMIATHPDSDHIGGLDDVLVKFDIDNVIVYSTNKTPTTVQETFEHYYSIEQGITIHYISDLIGISSDKVLDITEDVSLKFYNTGYLTDNDTNDSSIVFTLEAYGTRVLFNGDAESQQENNYAPLVGDVDIFKLGHHGSKNGTSELLLNYIKPEIAIVSNGDYLGNSYSHPTFDALNRIYQYSSETLIYAVTGGNGSSSDRLYQRNGDIIVKITSSGYDIDSERIGEDPIEIRDTDYWKSINGYGDYYAGISKTLNGATLKAELHEIISVHNVLSYDDVWYALMETDEDPNNTNNVILLYSGFSYPKSLKGGDPNDWNREHVWAKSHGDFGTSMGPGTDIHHLRPTDVTINSARGNLDFDYSDNYLPECTKLTCKVDSDSFEPDDSVKGDVARMIFYMAVRYESGDRVDLELNERVNNGSAPYMGKLSVLLEWHHLDPVDDFELRRNNKIHEIQGNRNPFIDFPEFADIIFG